MSLQKRAVLFTTLLMSAVAIMIMLICYGIISVAISRSIATTMNFMTENEGEKINIKLSQIENSVNNLSNLVDTMVEGENDIINYNRRTVIIDHCSYLARAIIKETNDAVSCYVYFEPALSGGPDGFFYVKNDKGVPLRTELTDVRAYDANDEEHVAWYTKAKQSSGPIWLTPYYNANIDKYLISYVIPIYKNGRFVGVAGMDIDFEALVREVSEITVYDNGYAYLKSSTQNIHYHPDYFEGKDIHGDEEDHGVDNADLWQNENSEGNVIRYIYRGEDRVQTFTTLRNGLQLALCDSYDEVYYDRTMMITQIIVVVIVISIIMIYAMAMFMKSITKPIEKLTVAVSDIESGNYDIKLPENAVAEIQTLSEGIKMSAITLQEKQRLNESVLKKQNDQLRDALKASEQASVAKTTFLSRMSHEIRTPLNAIIGLDHIALEDKSLSSKTKSNLEKIGQSSDYLLTLINSILDMSRIESGKMTINNVVFPLRDLIHDVETLINAQCLSKGLTFNIAISEDIGNLYLGDELKLKQVMINLLGNSVKFTPEGGAISFSVCTVNRSGNRSIVRFIINDNGIGMDEEFQKHMFDPFSQENDGKTSKYGGSGLGLSISHSFIHMMNGTIEVDSTKGVGTKFKIDIPLESKDGEAIPVDDKEQEEEKADLTGIRILAAEDVEINAEILKELLEMSGCSIEIAENGRIAVDKFQEHEPGYYNLILMDIRMPEMDGLEAAATIRNLDREDAKTIPILAMTANAFEEDIQEALRAGMNEHLSKPVDPNLLFHTIAKWTEKVSKLHEIL